jgi:hypothetical protein
MAMPWGWKKKETKKLITLESEGYIIYIWKQGKNGYMIEAFKKGSGYKTRLFSKALASRRETDRFVSDLMKQKRIMRYTKFQPIFE